MAKQKVTWGYDKVTNHDDQGAKTITVSGREQFYLIDALETLKNSFFTSLSEAERKQVTDEINDLQSRFV